ncbi:MAG: nuclear transport factor 2 family protein [Acidobacteria bacterium]|nr:nuclear transport factor 2 family protein [Acidobacteriota bacterium]
MKQMKQWTVAALFAGWFLLSPALAGDIEEIKALEQGHYAARNRGDVATWMSYHVVGRDSFGPGGGPLTKSTSLEEEKKSLEASLAAGAKYNHQLKDIEVRIYGDTAICTSYITGSSTSPDGTVRPTNMRRTAVLVKMNGKWKEVHDHISPLVEPR